MGTEQEQENYGAIKKFAVFPRVAGFRLNVHDEGNDGPKSLFCPFCPCLFVL
jgi:hypothetical protein